MSHCLFCPYTPKNHKLKVTSSSNIGNLQDNEGQSIQYTLILSCKYHWNSSVTCSKASNTWYFCITVLSNQAKATNQTKMLLLVLRTVSLSFIFTMGGHYMKNLLKYITYLSNCFCFNCNFFLWHLHLSMCPHYILAKVMYRN